MLNKYQRLLTTVFLSLIFRAIRIPKVPCIHAIISGCLSEGFSVFIRKIKNSYFNNMMQNGTNSIQKIGSTPIEYLVLGHLTKDLINASERLGGTVTFSALTAKALGLSAGIVTAYCDDIDVSAIDSLWIFSKTSENTTTFRNISDGISRIQYLYQVAEPISEADVPGFDFPPKIVHLGPVAGEVDPNILSKFPQSMKCLTPQGWFRARNDENQVVLRPWNEFESVLSQADAAVISLEDVQKDEEMIAKMAAAIPVFVVTENYKGARVYWHNDVRYFNAPEVKYVDDTGAGDIFSAAFFYRYHFTKDPWEAGRFAVKLASWSVTRKYLESIPTQVEIEKAKMELIG
jgi:hypothetical protein